VVLARDGLLHKRLVDAHAAELHKVLALHKARRVGQHERGVAGAASASASARRLPASLRLARRVAGRRVARG
jgi:hypothetical protein